MISWNFLIDDHICVSAGVKRVKENDPNLPKPVLTRQINPGKAKVNIALHRRKFISQCP